MKKRYVTMVLAIALLLGMFSHFAIKADAVYIWIKDRSQVDGSDYTRSTALAAKLDSIFDGNASVYSDKSCTALVDTRIGTSNVKNDGVPKYVGPYGKSALCSGTSCWIYANGVYYTLFNECTGTGTAGANSVKLDVSTTSDQKVTYENFKAWGVREGVGALVRTSGHSMIVLGYDSNTLTILDGNGDNEGLVSIKIRSWDQINYTVSYIIQPKDSYYNAMYSVCEHTYNNAGVCTSCGEEYNFAATFITSSAGYYTVFPDDGIYLRTDKPYSASTAKSSLIPKGTKVEVLGSVTNALGNKWYKVSYHGATGYINDDNLIFQSFSEQSISCLLTAPAEGETVPQKSYPLSGTVKSKYPIQEVVAYIDGTKYATVTVGNALTLNLSATAVNNNLRFSSLSEGSHTLVLKARDIHNSSLITICTRNFISSGTTSCGHSYSSKVTTAATCTSDGVRTYTCSKCSASYTETVAATGHTYVSVVITPATCTTAGAEKYTCSGCSFSYATEPMPLGHSFTNYVSNNDATYEADGTKTAKCDRCNVTNTVTDQGSMLIRYGWKEVDGKWYYYYNCVKQTGWLSYGPVWYYFHPNGMMYQNEWLYYGGHWYYFNNIGRMVVSTWAQDAGKWYYFDGKGHMQTGWQQISGTWYYFKASGAMATGWLQEGGKWYYLKTSGAMQTGWLKWGSTWYYFNSSGVMATGTVTIGGKTYNFNSSGVCLNP